MVAWPRATPLLRWGEGETITPVPFAWTQAWNYMTHLSHLLEHNLLSMKLQDTYISAQVKNLLGKHPKLQWICNLNAQKRHKLLIQCGSTNEQCIMPTWQRLLQSFDGDFLLRPLPRPHCGKVSVDDASVFTCAHTASFSDSSTFTCANIQFSSLIQAYSPLHTHTHTA